ncbi:putative HTH-type transcriptional regulator [Candidatus Jidaibacter acanthamoeba]|uniref:Putative HTH-type transcriptional regulator n=1 Tax=Candidatus Jidaibacter acanthamoebae TaxID=86105 RepID=A0A0C1QXQ5_9RICK|nr:Rrf2 family transcriptional regulator [Candidatus Jidaibacter acanthamoeba]KIE04830.1 putative HTH-type transcriptional regulator [Candidatus Jidaibacter acanthamoeba]
MFLTTKGRYAVMAMVDLAINDGGFPQKLSLISERQGIDIAYLEQIFAKLKSEGLVKAFKGPGGGYKLAAVPAEVKIFDIMAAVEEQIRMTRCNNKSLNGCARNSKRCETHELWAELEAQISNFLSSVSLADVCNGRITKKSA